MEMERNLTKIPNNTSLFGPQLIVDEKEQILTIETRDQHKITMDDKNKRLFSR